MQKLTAEELAEALAIERENVASHAAYHCGVQELQKNYTEALLRIDEQRENLWKRLEEKYNLDTTKGTYTLDKVSGCILQNESKDFHNRTVN